MTNYKNCLCLNAESRNLSIFGLQFYCQTCDHKLNNSLCELNLERTFGKCNF